MAFESVISKFADFSVVCTEMAVLCWNDSELDERVFDNCAGCLAEAAHTLLKSNLHRPSLELIERNL